MTQAHSPASAHGSARQYWTGFAFSVILTVVAFAVVMYGVVPRSAILPCILLAAVAQIAVHLSYFLHLNTSPGQRWNLATFLFTVMIIGLILGGSLWIMANLHMLAGMPMDHAGAH